MRDRNRPVPVSRRVAAPLFAARLYPHRSLSREGFGLLMGITATVCLVPGLVFALAGAWPVFGFFGLDIALLWLAFRVNYRAARAFDEVALWRDDLLVRKHSAAGRIAEHRFNPFWARLRIRRHAEFGVLGLAVASRGREVPLGEFLNPPDRQSFAEAFGAALRRARGG